MTHLFTPIAAAETFSGNATTIELVRVAPKPQATRPKMTVAQLNRKLNADPDRVERLAKANTKRISGKPTL